MYITGSEDSDSEDTSVPLNRIQLGEKIAAIKMGDVVETKWRIGGGTSEGDMPSHWFHWVGDVIELINTETGSKYAIKVPGAGGLKEYRLAHSGCRKRRLKSRASGLGTVLRGVAVYVDRSHRLVVRLFDQEFATPGGAFRGRVFLFFPFNRRHQLRFRSKFRRPAQFRLDDVCCRPWGWGSRIHHRSTLADE